MDKLPVHKEYQANTAFCQGPGLGLFQFHGMPFGLSGTPASFQHLMDKICRECRLSPPILMMS